MEETGVTLGEILSLGKGNEGLLERKDLVQILTKHRDRIDAEVNRCKEELETLEEERSRVWEALEKKRRTYEENMWERFYFEMFQSYDQQVLNSQNFVFLDVGIIRRQFSASLQYVYLLLEQAEKRLGRDRKVLLSSEDLTALLFSERKSKERFQIAERMLDWMLDLSNRAKVPLKHEVVEKKRLMGGKFYEISGNVVGPKNIGTLMNLITENAIDLNARL